MPGDKSVLHPNKNIKITFTENDHKYIDSNNNNYISVTTIIGEAFEKFDSVKVAKQICEKRGKTWQELVKEWGDLGKAATTLGTRVHENCEYQINGEFDKMHTSSSTNVYEQILFNLAYKEVDKLLSNKNILKLETEKLIFSPSLKIAGSIDLFVTYKNGTYGIFDWKILSKGLSQFGFNNKCGILNATKNIPDSNYWHYALQLQIYEILLKVEKYISNDATVTRTLNVFTDGKFSQHEMPELKQECKELIKWVHYSYFKNMKKG
jgi:hypothetical protein